MKARVLFIAAILGLVGSVAGAGLPSPAWMKEYRAFETEFKTARLDSAVLWIGEAPTAANPAGAALFTRALGNAELDSRFDLASLTKGLATALAVHHLVDAGKLGYDDLVSDRIPEWKTDPGVARITVRDLLLHQSGLPIGLSLTACRSARAGLRPEIARLGSHDRPGLKFEYSDANYLVLGNLVESASGMRLSDYVTENFYRPLKLARMSFDPAGTVPTSREQKAFPHDPCAQAMAPVEAGHAGLYSDAGDLAALLAFILRDGVTEDGTRLLSSAAISLLTHAQAPLGVRAAGFDVDSPYAAAVRGPFKGGFGHTGYTGTSFWADPATGRFVILLTNRVYGGDTAASQKAIKSLRAHAAELAATL